MRIWANGAHIVRLVGWVRAKLDGPSGAGASPVWIEEAPRAASPLDGGVHPGLVQPLPQIEQDLWASDGKQYNLGVNRFHTDLVQLAGTQWLIFK